MKEIRYIHAINNAIKEEMERDENVVFIGEDVGVSGGAFGAARDLHKIFGPKRIIETPISEASFVTLAAGAASCGLRPIVEIMFMDFITTCMDSVVNQIAKMRYMFGNQYTMPIVVRAPAGAGLSAGPQHSQSLEAWFAHIPGLKVVMPATPYDTQGLLKSAIRDDNPVIFIENKALHAKKGEIPEEEFLIPIGEADIKKEGDDVTLVTAGRMVHESLKAAAELEEKGISVEVVDLRTIQPWDKDAVFNSIEKTNKLIIVHEAVKSFGFGAEISATVAEEMMDELDAPIARVAAPFVPVPFNLEQAYMPNVNNIIEAVENTVERTF
ncbi:alpha-ketoacid dehydrogenase subunit beta [Spirochaetota bacterium]